MYPGKERPAGKCRILKGLDAVWGHFCPSKPCLPLLIDGMFLYYIDVGELKKFRRILAKPSK